MAKFLKISVSFAVVLFGLVIGFLTFALAAVRTDREWRQFTIAACIGTVFFGTSLLATWRPKVAGWVLLVASLPVLGGVVWGVAAYGLHGVTDLVGAALCISLFVVPGLFWFLTARRKWPTVVTPNPSTHRAWFRTALTALCFLGFVLVSTVWAALNSYWGPPYKCPKVSWTQKRNTPGSAVVMGRLVRLGWPRTAERDSHWAVFHVENAFWGSPKAFKFFALKGLYQPEQQGTPYLVDAQRLDGILTRFVPVYEPSPCGGTAPLAEAEMHLRILRSAPPAIGVRVIGRVVKDTTQTPVAGAEVLIESPSGPMKIRTDAQGIYDVSGMPPGRYAVRISGVPVDAYRATDQQTLKTGDVGESTLYTNW